ncbi:NADH dehydrogenase [ubiquinone] 1 beta subcomplex subunit 3, partial [Biomphalaria glabrata]
SKNRTIKSPKNYFWERMFLVVRDLQRRLAALGLKDPWIRNEILRFHPSVNGTTSGGIVALRRTFRGFGIAVAAWAVTLAFDKLTNKGKTDDHGHH